MDKLWQIHRRVNNSTSLSPWNKSMLYSLIYWFSALTGDEDFLISGIPELFDLISFSLFLLHFWILRVSRVAAWKNACWSDMGCYGQTIWGINAIWAVSSSQDKTRHQYGLVTENVYHQNMSKTLTLSCDGTCMTWDNGCALQNLCALLTQQPHTCDLKRLHVKHCGVSSI